MGANREDGARFALTPGRITLIYLVVGGAWIVLTDVIAAEIAQDQYAFLQFELLKGGVYVGFTGALIYGLTSYYQRSVTNRESRLTSASQMRQVLSRVLRHDIRNDMNVVIGHARLLQDTARSEGMADVEAYTGPIIERGERLIQKAEKARYVDEMDLVAIPPSPQDVVALVDREVQALERAYPDVSVAVEAPNHAWVRTNEAGAFAIRELLENAVVHQEQPLASRQVRVTVSRLSTEYVAVRVADNGPGIPESDLEPLRKEREEPLHHADGVGLWMVKWIVTAQGGTFEVVENSDAGTTIELTFVTAPLAAFKKYFGRRAPLVGAETSRQ